MPQKIQALRVRAVYNASSIKWLNTNKLVTNLTAKTFRPKKEEQHIVITVRTIDSLIGCIICSLLSSFNFIIPFQPKPVPTQVPQRKPN